MSKVERDAAADYRLCSVGEIGPCQQLSKSVLTQRRRYDMATYINPEAIHIIFSLELDTQRVRSQNI
jgi:hypothetical protein